LGLAAYTRVDPRIAKRRDFFIDIDEFHVGARHMLSELRKYRLGFAIAHQFLHQLTPEIRHAVVGNIGTFIAFRMGPEDASYVLRELGPASQIERLLSGKPGMEDPPGLRPIVREFMRRVGCLTVPQQGSRFLPALFHS